jgi:hypothetical protein
VPPGRTWIPGTWQQATGGWQWVSGYWAVEGEAEEMEYLSAPPDSVDNGPSVPAPAENCTYVPGIWIYQKDRFSWRPGYWVPFRAGWVWVSSCYKWTPSGHVFVSGYWDVPLCERGLLFAPIRFTKALYLQRGFVFTPTCVVGPDVLITSLFVRVNTRCFCFGNYFEPRCRGTHVSWLDYRVKFNPRTRRGICDVNYCYYRAAHARHPDWNRNLRTLYTERYAGKIARPPGTLTAQKKSIASITVRKAANMVVHENVNITHSQNATVLHPLREGRNIQATGLARLANLEPGQRKSALVGRQFRLETMRKERRTVEESYAKRLRDIAEARHRNEVKLAAARKSAKQIAAPISGKFDLPKTTPPARVIKGPKPPPRPVRPRLEPRPRPGKS